MELSEIYQKGKFNLSKKEYGFLLDYVETGFVKENDRRVLDRYTIRQRCIDAEPAQTAVSVLGIRLASPVIMSAMTMPIPAMADDALLQLARGLKSAGSLMWTGTPLPKNLKQIADCGVPLAANVKPLKDRDKMFAEIDEILESGVNWLGIELDAGQGTKVRDKEMGFDCVPYTSKEIAEIKKRINIPLVCKGVLSREDAQKCVGAGVDLIVVSNHGGHTLDYLPHPLQMMDEIVATVNDQLIIMVDGSFRRGSDVLKGLAFGATVVGLGRPILYALAAGGENTVVDLISGIGRELARLMTMAGVATPHHIEKDILIEA